MTVQMCFKIRKVSIHVIENTLMHLFQNENISAHVLFT